MHYPTPYEAEKMARFYQEERWKEAEMERLSRRLLGQKRKTPYWLGRVAVWIGKQMVVFGSRLQAYHVPNTPAPGKAR
jgi:hypothetical protein